jgi:hypothetical protein
MRTKFINFFQYLKFFIYLLVEYRQHREWLV